jgi:glycosyltransferase involved in cell wall biosynthesis
MRILFVSPGELTGSHLPFVRREAHALRNAGHQVDVFGFDNSRYAPAHLVDQVLRLKAEIRRLRPDVVHAQFGKVNALAAACAAAGLAPLAITFRGTDINRNTRYSGLRSALGVAASQVAAFFAGGIVCVSGEIRDKVWARRLRRSLVLPTGVDLKAFVPGDRAAARARLGLGQDERIVLFNSGRNPAVKDPELAAEAVEDARRRVDNLRLVVLDGSAPPEEIPHYMNAADCLLVTSKTEGSPTVVQEAMACNLPVVSVDVGDVRERLAGVSGCAVVARCPLALGAALAGVLRAPRRSDGREHAAELGVDAITARLAGFYRDILLKGGDRDLGAKYHSAE